MRDPINACQTLESEVEPAHEVETFQALIEELAAAFVAVPAPDVDREIQHWLQRIVEHFDADRSSLAQLAAEGLVTTHTWARAGYESSPGVRATAVPWMSARLRRGEYIALSSLDELPAEAATDRALLEALQLRALVAMPLMVSGTFVGILSVGCIRHSRRWPEAVLQRIRLIGTVFGNAISRKRAMQEYLQLARALAHAGRVAAMGQLASSFAHEINQPLGASLTNAQTALRLLAVSKPDLAEVRAALEDIAADSSRAGEIVRELRRFLRKQEPHLTAVCVRELLEAVGRFVSPEARGKAVEVEIEVPDAGVTVCADRVQLQQVLVNLLLNAFDALAGMPLALRRVAVSATRLDDRVQISVADTGPGVAADVRHRLFEPFATSKADGLGLGLSIAQTILAAHGTRLKYSERVAGGAVFTFSLPLESAHAD